MRVKPILMKIKEKAKKDSKQEILLQGLENLIKKILSQNTENMTVLVNSLKDKKNDSPSASSGTTSRTTKLTKPAKVPSWTKDMSMETYAKQIATWTDINEDVPAYVKYDNFIEELKRNKEIS